MHLDVSQLAAFYRTPLGRVTRTIVTNELRAMWPDVREDRIVGLGHATPFLAPFADDAERVCALMPAAEGVQHWPDEGPNRTALVFGDELPLPDSAIDKLLIIHALESAHDPFHLLREVWRILAPSGRMIVVVPYRSGAWARADHTPFGLGRPYSRFQLRELLLSAWLSPTDMRRFLFVAPSQRRSVLTATRRLEGVGRKVMPRFAGILAVEAEKTSVRGLPVHKTTRGLRIFVPGLAPVPKPAMPQRAACDDSGARDAGGGR